MTERFGEAQRIWTAPVLIAVVTTISLFGALFADGAWDGLWTFLLSAALAYAVALGLRSDRGRAAGDRARSRGAGPTPG